MTDDRPLAGQVALITGEVINVSGGWYLSR